MPVFTRVLGTGLLAAALLLGGLARADNPPVATDDSGRAIKGYDAVAYFTDGKPEPGDPAYAYEWMDATWLFATPAHRDAFAADPSRYAPQFGGYCAWAVANGHALGANPEVWSIVEDKLYLNVGPGAQKRWREDVPGNIARAERNWPDALVDPGRRKSAGSATSDR